MDISHKMQVELFHLIFLRLFNNQVALNLYAIKGGCNLRFFFNSIRYSEDLDIDVHAIQKNTLKNKVSKILSTPTLLKLTQGYGINKIEFSTPKQTQTTQRWKIQLLTQQSQMPLHTKIEFSRRHEQFNSELSDLSRALCQLYKLPPTRLSHYGIHEAITQKILALANRSFTQSRDIFDLYLLLHIEEVTKTTIPIDTLDKAINATKSIGFSDYKSQVVSFLEPNEQAIYDDKNYWQTLSTQVITYLMRLKNASS